MGIWSSMLGRREPAAGYRTVDGGHPAPYPDMTDEQLYNYELAFNIPRKTFDRPPPSRTVPPAPDEPEEPEAEPSASAEQAIPAVPPVEIPAAEAGPPLDFSRPIRTRTTRQPVDIITTRARHPVYKVHGYIGDDEIITVFTLDGRLSENGAPFLENVPQTRQLWINVYPNHDARGAEPYVLTQHGSREEADAAAGEGRIACVSLQFDL